MIKGIFVDFYGTIVHEDTKLVKKISKAVCETGNADNPGEVDEYWWKHFKELFENSYGDSFRRQRELELESIMDTIRHFESVADGEVFAREMFEFWRKPDIFEESKKFFEECPVPIFVVSNIDRADIVAAVEYHGLCPQGIFTSEDAQAYKPRPELFRLALEESRLNPNEVLHVGDSLSSDVVGAHRVGIKPIWINRGGRKVPDKVTAVNNLLEVLDYIKC